MPGKHKLGIIPGWNKNRISFRRMLYIRKSDKTRKADTILLFVPISIIFAFFQTLPSLIKGLNKNHSLLSWPFLWLLWLDSFHVGGCSSRFTLWPTCLVSCASWIIMPVNLLCFLGHSSYYFAGSRIYSHEKQLRECLAWRKWASGETLLLPTINRKEVVARWVQTSYPRWQCQDERKWPQAAPGEV